MKIAFNPSTVAALTAPPNNKDITFDLRGRNIFARGVKFYGTDTNTWRDIKIDGVSIGSHTLDLRNGSNTTLTNKNGIVTINSTWRPVVDNLTSDSTTSSLSAKQGKVLAGLIKSLDTNISNQYALRNGSNATGRWRGGLACLDVRDTNYTPHDLNSGLELLFLNNNTNNLKDGGAYNGVFSFRQWSSGSDWSGGKAHQLSFTDNGNIWHRTSSGDDFWETWKKLAYYTDIPSSLKNPHALTISLNGTSQGPYDGSAAKSINITAASVGAATSDHNHDGRYVYNYGGTADVNGQALNQNALFMSTTSGISGEWWHILQAAWNGEYRWNSQIAFPTQDRNGMYYRSGLDNNTKWGAWVKLLDTNNYSSVLDIRYITDIATSTNKLTFTRNGSNIDRSVTVNVVQSLGRRSPLTERNAISGIYTYGTYSNEDNLAPTTYFETLGFGEGTAGTIEIGGSWISSGQLYWRALRDISDNWFSWKTILDSSNYAGILDSRYYTESEVNSLLSTKLDRVNLSTGGWNPRGYNLAADYSYNGGDLSISESGGQIHVSVDGYFWQNEGQYRVLDTSDVAGIRGSISIQQYLSNTDTNWYPIIWGGDDHRNTYTSTGAVYKSHDVLSWQTSSQTLYATRLATNSIDLQSNRGIFQVTSGGTSPYKGISLPDLQSNGLGMFSKIGEGNGADEGGIIISADTSVIYNSFDTGWGLTIRDKDRGQMDISGEGTIAFGVRQDYKAYSLGGFEKSGSNNSYVLLGGGDHKLESALRVAYATNADKLDGNHYSSFAPFNGVKFVHGPDANIWHRILQFTTDWVGQITFMYSPEECQRSYWGMFNINIRSKDIWFKGFSFADLPQFKCCGDDNNNWSVWIKGDPNEYNPYGVIQVLNFSSASIVSIGIDKSQTTEPSGTYNKAPSLFYAGSVDWNSITGKPSAFTPAEHTHTVFRNNLMIKGTNGLSAIASIHLGIGDSDTGFKWISDGVCQIYANNVAIGQWTSGGMNWFANPTVNGNKVWNAGNDGSGSGLDADMLDGYHENSFLRYRGATNTDQEATLWDQIGIKSYGDALPDGLTNIYNYGSVISLPGSGSRFEIYASHLSSAGNGLYYRSGWNNDKRPWLKFIDSSNIGSQSVNYANSAGNADTVDGYHATDGRTFNGAINWGSWGDNWSDGTNKHPWYGFDHRYPNTGAYSTTITDYFGMTIKTANTLRLDFSNLLLNGTSIYDINVASATKVIVNQHTSNDTNYPLVWSNQPNTSNVTENQLFKSWEDLYYNPKNKILAVGGYFMGPWARFTDQNGALVIGDNISARISAIGDQIIFNTGSSLRFGETAWDWNQWAGLKYKHSAKTIYLGIADDSVFNARSAQSNGTLKFPGISNIDLDNGAQIRREGSSQAWVTGRSGALLRETSVAGYHTLWSLKTTDGSWDFGEYNAGSGWNNVPILSYVTDSNYASGNNTTTYQIRFPLDSGTVALTKNIPSSLPANGGNADTLDGVHLNGIFTAFGNNAHNITATIGGVTKSFLVNYAADADKVDGVHITWAGALTSTSHLVAWEADGSALRDINPANVTVGSANYASNADTVDGYHASQLAKAWSGSGTMNQVAQNNGNYFGMITGTGTGGFPNDDGGWTHVFQSSYNNNSGGDGNTGNFWITQIANRAGTTSPWIRSRAGGSDITTGWTDWVRIMTKNDVDNYYWANIKVSTSSNTQTTPTFNTAYATNWFRARGNSGFYFQDHAGGWYMSDNDWIRTWGSKALYVNNTIRSTNYQAMYGSTSVSAAKLESASSLVYGTDTSSNSINTYLRGTNVTLQVKKGASINYNALQLTDTYIYCNNYCDMKQGAIVSGGNFTVNNNAYFSQDGIQVKVNDQKYYRQPTCIACGYAYDGPNANNNNRTQQVVCNQHANITLIDGNGRYRIVFPNIQADKFNREHMSLQLTGCPHGIDSRGVSDARGSVSSYGNALSIEVYTSDDNSLNPSSFYFALWTWEYIS